MGRLAFRSCLLALALIGASASAAAQEASVEVPSVVFRGASYDVALKGPPSAPYRLEVGGQRREGALDDSGSASVRAVPSAPNFEVRGSIGEATVSSYSETRAGWLSLLPPLLAILLALILHQVVLALAAGVWCGATILTGDPFGGLLSVGHKYGVEAAADSDHASILIFSLLLGGMIGVIGKSGGSRGLASLVTKRATTRKRGQLATWILGLLVFFDDYANALLVGSTMRPITDRLKISREKLAFLVDATAAPVASLALISSWIGVEIGYIGEQFSELGIEQDAYLVFLETIPYRFYPLLMLAFGLMLLLMGKDFGPMLKAERAALEGEASGDEDQDGSPRADAGYRGEEAREDGPPARPLLALLPIATVIGAAVVGMYVTGSSGSEEGAPLRDIFGNASSLKALMWGAMLGGLVAIVASVATGALSLAKTMESWLEGMKGMLLACVILVLAWSLGAVCKEMHTASYVIGFIGDGIAAGAVPAVVFVIAAAVAFATGSSWGTMAILFPLVIPLAHELAPTDMHVVLGAIASILSGSVWGDHCSPISDTTIMSSMATDCDHVAHVKTQLPYALSVGLIALVLGELPVGFGLYPVWVGLGLSVVALYLLLRFVGRDPRDIEVTATD